MNLDISSNTKIYILAPANIATGGPELLHQLGYNLKQNDINVYMVYYAKKEGMNPVADEYKVYDVPVLEDVQDIKENIIIVPEVETKFVKNFTNIQKIIWWLSVDNYYYTLGRFLGKPFIGKFNKLVFKFFHTQNYFGFEEKYIKSFDFHLVQSEYAKQFLLSKNIPQENIKYLSDYLNLDFLQQTFNNQNKENMIVYNPKKGFFFTRQIISYIQDTYPKSGFTFQAIENMSRGEVIELFKKSKIYIDFGNFPGKDRIPREAAMLGNIVITGTFGASKYYKDIQLENKFKIKNLGNFENIYRLFSECIENFEENLEKQYNFREVIQSEPKRFEDDVRKIFN